MKTNPNCLKARGGFTLVELLVVVVMVAALAAIIFSFTGKAMKKANGMKDMATMRNIWNVIPIYAADNNGIMPGPLNSGQKSLYGPASTGRLSFYIAEQLGYDNLKRDELMPLLAFSWQKSQAQLNAPCFYMPETVLRDGGSNVEIRPWGHPLRSGANRKPLSLAAVLSRIDPARQWAISDLDQLHPGVGSAGWRNEIPAEMSHGDYRIAIYFDGHAGKLDVNNEPR